MNRERQNARLNVLSPEIFLPLFILGFYLVGITLVEFSVKALLIVMLGVGAYLLAVHLTGSFLDRKAESQAQGSGENSNNKPFSDSLDLQESDFKSSEIKLGSIPSSATADGFRTATMVTSKQTMRYVLQHDYFERLLLSLLALFVIDLAVKGFLPLAVRAPLYLVIIAAVFYAIGKRRFELTGRQYLMLGLSMILTYIVPAFVQYGLYGSYLNRTGGLMPAFLVGMGTITTVYGLMKTASKLADRDLYIMIAAITIVAGPLMAALIGYRAYAIIYILPLIFQYYLERKPPSDLKSSTIAITVVAFIFIYTYFATSVARGAVYMFAPLDKNAPAFVVESMESGHYTDKDMRVDNAKARNKFLTRPFFTYKVFLDVIDVSYPWGKSHGRLIVSLMPGMTKGRATTISILKKPLSTSFFGLSFLEFGLAGVAFYGALLGFCFAVISRFRNPYVYALTLTIVMLWLDTGPSVWWHWLPFATAFPAIGIILMSRNTEPKSRLA